jgi:hypothetical protein
MELWFLENESGSLNVVRSAAEQIRWTGVGERLSQLD